MFNKPEIQFLPSGVEGVVESDITLLKPGLVKIQGRLWRAKPYELNGQSTLRSQQAVVAIAREGSVLLVIPSTAGHLTSFRVGQPYQTL